MRLEWESEKEGDTEIASEGERVRENEEKNEGAIRLRRGQNWIEKDSKQEQPY